MECYIKDYPRPQFVRKEWQSLNGEWNFIFDDKDEGETKKYFANFPIHKKINVPFTYETKLSGIEDETIHCIVWYNKKIKISKEHEATVTKEEQTITDIERELQLEINLWSKEYTCGTSRIAYNSYTKKYKGHISKGGKWNEQGIYVEKDGRDIDISREEFRNGVYYEIMQNIKNDEDSLQSDKDNYLSQLNEVYHLSD